MWIQNKYGVLIDLDYYNLISIVCERDGTLVVKAFAVDGNGYKELKETKTKCDALKFVEILEEKLCKQEQTK